MPSGTVTSVGGGVLPQRSSVLIFGDNPEIDVLSTPEDVWSAGGLYPFPVGAAVTDIVSDNAADTNISGIGGWLASVVRLNANLGIISEVVALNGLTPIVLSNQYRRIHRVIIITAGSNGSNVGTITIRHPGPVVIGNIAPGTSTTQQAIFTVPRSFVNCVADSITFSVVRQQNISARCVIQSRELLTSDGLPFADGTFVEGFITGIHSQGSGAFQLQDGLIVLNPGLDVRLRITEVTTNNSEVAAALILQYDGPPQL